MKNKPVSSSGQVRSQLRNYYWGVFLFIIAVVAVVLILVLPDKAQENQQQTDAYTLQKNGTASFLDKSGKTFSSFDIEIAETPEKLQAGLMYRDSLASNQGMLFLFDNDEIRSFWMKNTYLPLDIVFINADSLVVSVSHNTVPFSEDKINSEGPSRYVLEINAGQAEKLNIVPGQKLIWHRN